MREVVRTCRKGTFSCANIELGSNSVQEDLTLVQKVGIPHEMLAEYPDFAYFSAVFDKSRW